MKQCFHCGKELSYKKYKYCDDICRLNAGRRTREEWKQLWANVRTTHDVEFIKDIMSHEMFFSNK